jgi:hypothetical protein
VRRGWIAVSASKPTNDRIVMLLEDVLREVREVKKLQDRIAADVAKTVRARG